MRELFSPFSNFTWIYNNSDYKPQDCYKKEKKTEIIIIKVLGIIKVKCDTIQSNTQGNRQTEKTVWCNKGRNDTSFELKIV